jgi:crotonobetainyl-CoA:carnitine CoA-transferase CaiB-like acyl-CoA transferase
MKGMRVIEVAEQGFVPGAGALLADWGADVIKIEPMGRGDAARGITSAGATGVNVLFHHANRGKKGMALDLSKPEGRDIIYRLAKKADVFLTNKLPGVRKKLKIDVDDIRAHNLKIVYARGSGQGAWGPEQDRGAYDLLTYWHRAGISSAVASPRGELPFLPAPGFGDFTGSMFLAGGIMGALLHRERTGEAPIVDASLLATGMWAMGSSTSIVATEGSFPWPPPIRNPLSAIYPTKDGRHLALCCLQAGAYWRPLCEIIGRPDLAADPRFSDYPSIIANSAAAERLLGEVFLTRTRDAWIECLENFSGQWTIVQTLAEVVADPQANANGYVQNCISEDGLPFKLVAAPIQYDGIAAAPERGPTFGEHGDALLAEIGFDVDAMMDLKARGVVA